MKDEYDAGIIAKLERALALRDQLRDMQVQLREQRDQPEYESRSNARGDDTNPVVWIEWILKKAPEALPLAFSALLGDAIQNLRAALDYCARAAVSDEIRRTQPRDVSFPLYEDAVKFATWQVKRESGYGKPTLDVIGWAQPFHAPTDALHPLLVPQHLSNVDKHRLLNVVEYAAIDLGTIAIEPEPILKN